MIELHPVRRHPNAVMDTPKIKMLTGNGLFQKREGSPRDIGSRTARITSTVTISEAA